MSIDLILLTYNRLEYTKLTLGTILADPTEEFSLTIWDNGSTDGTVDYLKGSVRDPRIREIVYSPTNVGQLAACNTVFSKSKADLLGKLDNDCLLTPGWTRPLSAAHRDIPKLGVVACWHFFPEDFDHEKARAKIQRFGEHQLLRHPWTCGTGLLFKRSTYQQLGPLTGRATTEYWIRMAEAGFINGFYYPPVWQEHMDDVRSKHYQPKPSAHPPGSPAALEEARLHREEYLRFHQGIIDNLLTGPIDPKAYQPSLLKRAARRVKAFFKTS